MLPNRLELLRKFVAAGGGLLMVGGWLSFQGRFGQGVWHGTPVEEALPVIFQATDDRVETPQGATVSIKNRTHPVMRGIAWDKFPPLLGYNRATARPGVQVLATLRSSPRGPDDPLIVVREYELGRTMAFASDTTPHWGVSFMKWGGYQQFWRQATHWLAGSESDTGDAQTPSRSKRTSKHQGGSGRS